MHGKDLEQGKFMPASGIGRPVKTSPRKAPHVADRPRICTNSYCAHWQCYPIKKNYLMLNTIYIKQNKE
jgi:hypothetical protein